MATDTVFAVDHDRSTLNKSVGKPLSFVIYIQVYIHKHSHPHTQTHIYTQPHFGTLGARSILLFNEVILYGPWPNIFSGFVSFY